MTRIIVDRDQLLIALQEQAKTAIELRNNYQGLESHEYTFVLADKITKELEEFDDYSKELLKQSFSGTIDTNEYLKEFSEIIHMNNNLKMIPLSNNPNFAAADIISKQVILRNMHEFFVKLVKKFDLIPQQEEIIGVQTNQSQEYNLLILSSNPGNLEVLNYGKEHRDIRNRIKETGESYRVIVHDRSAVRIKDILDAINEINPDLIHFSGHGASDSFAIQDDSGDTIFLDSKNLNDLIKSTEGVQVIFLSTCHSKQISESLIDTVPIAIGMDGEIGDEDAIVFASQFYSSLAYGKSISTAFSQAKVAVVMENLSDSEVPKLYYASDIDPLDFAPLKYRD